MLPNLNKIKGVHPGAILRRALKKEGLKGSELAACIGEHKQTISAILNKRRDINPKLSIKLSIHFQVEADYFMLLQASYNVRKAESSEDRPTPNTANFRKVVFWDTDIDKIDWKKHSKVIIKRVLERGNTKEINEIISFYGKEKISREIKKIKISRLPSFENNIKIYNL